MKPIFTCIGIVLSLYSCSPTELDPQLISTVQHTTIGEAVSVDEDDSKNKLRLDLDGDDSPDLLITAFNSAANSGCGNYDFHLTNMSSTVSLSFTEAAVASNSGIISQYINNITPGHSIGPSLSWVDLESSKGILFHDTHGTCTHPEITSFFFSSPTERETSAIRIMPFQMRSLTNGNLYYGWIKLNGEYLDDEKNTVKLTVIEFAYNTHIGETIPAGLTQ